MTKPDCKPMTDASYWGRVPAVRSSTLNAASPFQPVFDQWLPHGAGREAIEIGAYPGRHLAALTRSHGYRPVALDFLPRIHDLQAAFRKSGLPDVETIQSDFLEWNPHRSFAVVMSFGFIEHFAHPAHVLRLHWRLVEDGGYLVVSTPLFGTWQWLLRMCIYDASNRKKMYLSHNVAAMRPKALDALCNAVPEAEKLFSGPFAYMNTWFRFRDPYVRAMGNPAIACWKLIAWLPRLLKASSYSFSPYAVVVLRRSSDNPSNTMQPSKDKN